MEERVRIYELSKRMSIPNQEIIQTLRELGYDVKSHSSTVDSNAVGRLIAALGKKNEGGGAQATKKTAKTIASAKTSASVPAAPEKKKDKPKRRVLARYPKKQEPKEGTEADPAAAGEVSPGPGLPGGPAPLPASHISSTPRIQRPPIKADGELSSSTISSNTPMPESAVQAPPAPTAKEQTAQDESAPKAPSAKAAPTQSSPSAPSSQPARPVEKTKAPKRVEEPAQAPKQEEEDPVSVEPVQVGNVTGDSWSDESKFGPRTIRNLDKHFEQKQKKEQAKAKAKEDEKEKDASDTVDNIMSFDPGEADAKGRGKGSKKDREKHQRTERAERTERPMAPSVPIRVAAPSMRATPPRPPKSHRHSQVKKEQKKEEEKQKEIAAQELDVPKVVTLTRNLTVQELAEAMKLPVTEIIKHLFTKGIMRTVNQLVELELAKEMATELEYEILTEEKVEEKPEEKEEAQADDENLINRPPVVTIMGHVDHGKTSLLDAIRQAKFKITDEEAGGITQHIGAYHVEVEHEEGLKQIVFLDTPGHEAFTAMRARGAKSTDIAILVVAADDGVMPQTKEAIDHAKAAKVPIIVAVNKIDLPGAEPERVLTQLMEHDLLAESFGGDTVTVNVSAKKKTGLDDLLDMILLVADLQDLKANPEKPAEGVIVEAELSRGKGAVATALVQNGTLREGDLLVVGSTSGRVRALFDDRGNRVKAAGPSMPVEVLGLDSVPQAGDPFEVVEDMQEMKGLVEDRQEESGPRRMHHVTLESLHDMLESGEVKELNVIVKADVQGTAEAIADSVIKLSDENVQVRVLRAASGNISENDVNLATSSDAIIIGFNAQADPNARAIADTNEIDIRSYSIIYQITEDITKAIQGLLEPIREEVKLGTAEIRQVFKVGKGTMIAGCMVQEGKIQRGCIARIEREGQQIYDGKIDTLKRFKDDVREVAQGFECGMSFEKFTGIEEGDKVHAYIIKETKRGE